MENHRNKLAFLNLMSNCFFDLDAQLENLKMFATDHIKTINNNTAKKNHQSVHLLPEDIITFRDDLSPRLMKFQLNSNHLRIEEHKNNRSKEKTIKSSKNLKRRSLTQKENTASNAMKENVEKCSEDTSNSERITNWANSLENLLQDTIGLKIFTRFLAKEFCDENIHFWLSCEKYKNITKRIELKKEAKIIYERHLSNTASEQINIDCKTRNALLRSLCNPTKDIFLNAQAQIYDLMKNDCYKRFLSSDLYKKCLECKITGESLPYCSKDDCDPFIIQSKTKRRLSLPSWNNRKTMKS